MQEHVIYMAEPMGRVEPTRPDAATVSGVRAIRRFTVRTVLPENLAPLEELAINLRWSWDDDRMVS